MIVLYAFFWIYPKFSQFYTIINPSVTESQAYHKWYMQPGLDRKRLLWQKKKKR